MPVASRLLLPLYLLACLLALLGLGTLWYGLGKPVLLPDAAHPTHKLQCASYTPFDKEQSPSISLFACARRAWTPTWPCWRHVFSAFAPIP